MYYHGHNSLAPPLIITNLCVYNNTVCILHSQFDGEIGKFHHTYTILGPEDPTIRDLDVQIAVTPSDNILIEVTNISVSF